MMQLERLAANAWPALRCTPVDGWVVRVADGFSRRANSVLPWASGHSPLADRITRCESLYAMEGLEPAFKIFPGTQPEHLDVELAHRGYVEQANSTVMALDALDPTQPAPADGWRVSSAPRLTEEWLHVGVLGGGLSQPKAVAAKAILEGIVPERRFLLLEGDNGPAACALVVLEESWAGIFEVMVRREWRGRGLGRAIMAAALAEAAASGARHSYLQVLDANEVAVNLYRSLGYRPVYPYWYRVKAARA